MTRVSKIKETIKIIPVIPFKTERRRERRRKNSNPSYLIIQLIPTLSNHISNRINLRNETKHEIETKTRKFEAYSKFGNAFARI